MMTNKGAKGDSGARNGADHGDLDRFGGVSGGDQAPLDMTTQPDQGEPAYWTIYRSGDGQLQVRDTHGQPVRFEADTVAKVIPLNAASDEQEAER